ncbi:MAG: hypothetical protein Q4B26_19435 [Eubacteriales bacterium]|nr:hypothetical protein [Eubacteriales bacterium]
MQTSDKQYYIYIRSTNTRVPCTKEQFKSYYRDIDAYRRTRMNHGQCTCPPSKWLTCDMDCCNCPYRTSGKNYSLDSQFTDKKGNPVNWLDFLQESMPDLQAPRVDEVVTNRSEALDILERLAELMPVALEIGRLREQGFTDTAISEEIGIPRKTFTDRLKRVRDELKADYPEFF